MSKKQIGDGFIQLTDIGTSPSGTIAGNLTMNGNVELPTTTFLGGSLLTALIGSGGSGGFGISSTMPPVNVVSATASDTWIVTTNNTDGTIYPQVTCALDPAAASAISAKQSPIFTSANQIVTTTDWPVGTGWLISASSYFQNNANYQPSNAADSTGSYWTSADNTFSGGVGDQFWQIQYPSAVNVLSFQFQCAINTGSAPTTFSLSYSDDSINWVVAQNYNILASAYVTSLTAVPPQIVPPVGSHRYFRIRVTRNISLPYLEMENIRFFTGFTAAGLKLSSVLPISSSQFKLVMTDVIGTTLKATDIPIDLPFYISLFKNGQVVNSGKYTFVRNNATYPLNVIKETQSGYGVGVSSTVAAVKITGATASDSWTVTTDNADGNMQVQAIPAYDVAAVTTAMNAVIKTTPSFSNNTTIASSTIWPSTGWEVSAESFLTGYEAFRAVSGSGIWDSATRSDASNNMNTWWKIKFPYAVGMKSFTASGSSNTQNPTVWYLQYSNDNSTFVTLATYGTLPTTSTLFTISTNHPPAMYWRIYITKSGAANMDTLIGGLSFNVSGTYGPPTLLGVTPTSTTQFKIVLADQYGYPINMTGTTQQWPFNIMITKAGVVVNSGKYTFVTGNATYPTGVIVDSSSQSGLGNWIYGSGANSILTGKVGIGTTAPRVALDIVSTTAILAPAGTDAERPTGVKGLLRYNTVANAFEGYSGSGTGSWTSLGSGSGSGTVITPVEITGVTLTDSFTVATTNATGSLQVNVTPTFDPATVATALEKVSPVFTANTTPVPGSIWPSSGWEISASEFFDTLTQPFHSTTTGNWVASSTNRSDSNGFGNWWIQLKFPVDVTIKSFAFGAQTNRGPQTWALQSSTNGSSFTTIGSEYVVAKNGFSPTVPITFSVTTTHAAANYWRINITKISTANEIAAMSRLSFSTQGIVPTVTSVVPVSASTFKIVLYDANGYPFSTSSTPINMVGTSISWPFNIVMMKDGYIVNSGNYSFSTGGVVKNSGGFNNLGVFSTPTGLITSNVGVGDIRENPKFTADNTVATDFNTTYGWSTGSGWAVRASSNYDSTIYQTYRAFDKGSNDWISVTGSFSGGYPVTPQWTSMKFPEQVYIRTFSILCNDNTNYSTPREFAIQGSNDGSNWTTLQSYTNQINWTISVPQTFGDISATHPPYFNFRLLIQRVVNSGAVDVRITELKLFTQSTNTTTTAGALNVNGTTTLAGALTVTGPAVLNGATHTQVKIGANAGLTSQGASAIAIGNGAGQTNQAANSIVINATGSALNNNATNDTSSCFIKPIKNKVATGKEVLMYDTTTGEVTSTAIPNVLSTNKAVATYYLTNNVTWVATTDNMAGTWTQVSISGTPAVTFQNPLWKNTSSATVSCVVHFTFCHFTKGGSVIRFKFISPTSTKLITTPTFTTDSFTDTSHSCHVVLAPNTYFAFFGWSNSSPNTANFTFGGSNEGGFMTTITIVEN